MIVVTVLSVAACGGDRGVRRQASAQNAETAAPDAGGPDAGSLAPEAAAPALPTRRCPPAHVATLGECSDGLRCLLILEISDTCVVKVANEIDIPDVASVSDGGGIGDISWPKQDGPLYLVNMVDTWTWTELASPLTAARDALTKATWTPAKVGDIEPEGYQYGLVTDGAKPILVGCKKWGDHCGPDAEECEEWHCTKHVFVDPHTKKKIAKAPQLPFTGGAKTGQITASVVLGTKGKEKTCAEGTAAPETWYGNDLDGSIALSATDWLALRYADGSRMGAKWDLYVTYMRGCHDDSGNLEGSIVLGPNQLWARAVEGGWEIQHGPYGAPLTDATGKIKAFGDGPFVFTPD